MKIEHVVIMYDRSVRDEETSTRIGDEWELTSTLGEGTFGEVKLAINVRTQETCACKVIDLKIAAPDQRTLVHKEVLIQKMLAHDNVLKHVAAYLHQHHVDKFYMMLEYAPGGDLFDRIDPDYGMSVRLARRFFAQLVDGVEYLHSMGVVHRDIKPENLVFGRGDQMKIADFGCATLFRYRGQELWLSSICGTRMFYA